MDCASTNGGAAIAGYVVTPYTSGVAQTPRTFASAQLSQVITGLTNNVQYTFTVAAKNGIGTGLASAPMTPITVGAAKVPGAPTGLTVVPGNGQVALRWTAPADSGSATISRYVVTPSVGGVAKPARTYNTATTQVVTGLANTTAYRFTVRAGNAAGNSLPTAATPAVIVGTPTVPLSVSGVGAPGRITVSWGTPASTNGSEITGYVITPCLGTVPQPQVVTGVVNSRAITGLVHTKTYTFKVAAKNARGTGPQSTASPGVNPNATPVARADSYTTNEDTGLDVAAPGLLANDSDADHDPLEIELVAFPGGGLDLHPDGSFSYEPSINQDADDFFTYRVGDGITWSAPVLVKIDVIAVNDPPEVEGEQYETDFNTVLDVGSPGVLANDFDPVEFDGVVASGPTGGPFHGTVVLRSNGSFTYTPNPGYSGFDSFTYLVSDSQPGGTATAEITVLDPPCEGDEC